MTVPVTVRIGSRATEKDVGEKVVNPASRQRMRKPFMENVFMCIALPLLFIGSMGLRIGKIREDVNGISNCYFPKVTCNDTAMIDSHR